MNHLRPIIQYCEFLLQKQLYVDSEKLLLFERSVTHESVDPKCSYERLEWLGDSIMGYIIASLLCNRFPNQNENFLTEIKIKIVNSSMLSWLCRCIKLHVHIRISDSINLNKIQEDVFEAFVGAFYLSYGMNDTYLLVTRIIENPNFVDFTDLILNDHNYKKRLMITLQKSMDGRLPVFHTLPSPDNLFYVVVCHPNGSIMGVGVSKIIKLAQQSACKMALERVNCIQDADHMEYQSLLEKRRFEKVVDYEINENNIFITKEDITSIWRKYGIELDEINNINVYQSALIHKTYLQVGDPRYAPFGSNEKLNFLGNSVLMYFITEYLYQKYPTENEGFLTRIKTSEMQNRILFSYCLLLELNKFIVLARNDEPNRFHQSHSEQLFCSYLAAMTMDQGLDVTRRWVYTLWNTEQRMVNVVDENYKHQLLLRIQENQAYKFYKYPFPTYRIVASETNFEKKIFSIEVLDPNGLVIGNGVGKTKKEAEQTASKNALDRLLQNDRQQNIGSCLS
jgi:ribonuclease-3